MDKSLIAALLLLPLTAWGQTHTMPGSNVVPSGASLTIQSGGTINAVAGSTVTGFGGGGAPTTATYITQTSDAGLSAEVPLSGLATGLLKSTITTGALATITDNSTNWNTAFTQTRQWDGGSTGLVAATGRTSLALVPGTNVEVPLTFSTGLTRSTNTVTVNTSQNIATLSNLTTNGFVKTGGAVGTLSVDTATYQASAATLTSWAAITRASGFDTFVATPSSANLRGTLTDENGTGAALFSGATSPDFTTGITVGAAAASGKILQGNGTVYTASTPTYPLTAGTKGSDMRSDGTNYVTNAVPYGVVTATVDQTAVTETAHVVYTVPANSAAIGTTFRLAAWGDMDNSTTAITFTPRIRWGGTGGTQLLATPAVIGTTTALTNKTWRMVANVTIRTIGASGTAFCEVQLSNHTASTTGAYAGDEASSGGTGVVVNTTTSNDLDLTWTLSATTGTPHVRTYGGYMEIIN